MKAGSGARWLVVITVLAPVAGLIIYSYADWPGSGYIGIDDKKFWDYLELLIVPAALAFGVYWLNRAQQERESEDADRREREREAQETAQGERELEVENRRAQDAVLQAYIDQMGQLLLDKDKPLRQSNEGDEVSTLARSLTLIALAQIDGPRKGTLIQFLSEARLIQAKPDMPGGGIGPALGSGHPGWAQRRPIIGLTSADLSDIDLSDADLNYVILGEANLSGANLRGADLSNAILFNADLTGADLFDATVS